MVDANQGWRMPGDREPRWDVATAAQCARALEPLGVYWLEEPLRTDDVDGYAALRGRTDLRLAAGEMVRGAHEARDLVVRGGVDVDPDATSSSPAGSGAAGAIAALADLHGRAWSPHTWSNGYGLVANLHARARGLDVPVRRGAVRPARPGRRARATGCCRSRSDRRRRDDRAAARPRPRRRARPRGARAVAGRR